MRPRASLKRWSFSVISRTISCVPSATVMRLRAPSCRSVRPPRPVRTESSARRRCPAASADVPPFGESRTTSPTTATTMASSTFASSATCAAGGFGGEACLEQPPDVFGGDSRSLVADPDLKRVRQHAHGDAAHAAGILDRVDGIDDEIDDGMEQRGGRPERAPRTVADPFEPGAEAAHAPRHQIDGPLDDALDREGRLGGRLGREELLVAAKELLQAHDLGRHHLPVIEIGHLGRQSPCDQLETGLDAHQRMAHLVDEARPEQLGLLELRALSLPWELGSGHRRWAAAAAAGRTMVNVAPWPSGLSTRSLPWCASTMLWEIDNPIPTAPGPSLVVKNGSKIRSRIPAGMPLPVSLTESLSASPFTSLSVTLRVPPCGIAEIAFWTMCAIASCICAGSPWASQLFSSVASSMPCARICSSYRSRAASTEECSGKRRPGCVRS